MENIDLLERFMAAEISRVQLGQGKNNKVAIAISIING